MKVGIATFSWADNYGAVLQAFALQTYLEKLGYKVYIINYQPNRPTGILKQYFSKNPTGTLLKWENKYKRILFKRFRKKYFNLTPAVFESKEDLKKISNEFDLLVSGSDQVWNPKWLDQQEGLWDLCFLSFAGENTKVISYAASFGHKDLTTMKPKWQEEISAKLKKFVAISVREKSGINIVKSLTQNSNVFHVVDPTLLIDREYYINFISKTKIRKPYLLSYMLHGLGLKLAPYGISVNGIAPGIIDTGSIAIKNMDSKENAYLKGVPVSRIGLPEEIAELAIFLMSDAANYIVGQTIICDGGYTLKV